MRTRFAATRGPALVNTITAIQNAQPFDASALSGEPIQYGATMLGMLPQVWAEDMREYDVDYVVYSYATPIAWRVRETGEWVTPEVFYSPTTSRHQTTVRQALLCTIDPSSWRGYRLDWIDPEERPRITTLASIRRAAEVFA